MNLFTPLDKSYCNYFYYMSVFSFFIFCGLLIIGIFGLYSVLFKKIKSELHLHISTISLIINLMISSLLAYLVNRILYSMCIKSL